MGLGVPVSGEEGTRPVLAGRDPSDYSGAGELPAGQRAAPETPGDAGHDGEQAVHGHGCGIEHVHPHLRHVQGGVVRVELQVGLLHPDEGDVLAESEEGHEGRVGRGHGREGLVAHQPVDHLGDHAARDRHVAHDAAGGHGDHHQPDDEARDQEDAGALHLAEQDHEDQAAEDSEDHREQHHDQRDGSHGHAADEEQHDVQGDEDADGDGVADRGVPAVRRGGSGLCGFC